MFFARDGARIELRDLYKEAAAFLVCSGPSLRLVDLSLLLRRGVLTMAVNNAAAVHRPNLWTCIDGPHKFCGAIWRDPGILKLVPFSYMQRPFMAGETRHRVVDAPGVVGFVENEEFIPERWLHEDSVNWGQAAGKRDRDGLEGGCSVMFAALKVLFHLGIRRVYLLGCDFKMDSQQPYAFKQSRSEQFISENNRRLITINKRLKLLRPYFDDQGFQIVNCTAGSSLTAFPYRPFSECVEEEHDQIPKPDTDGMYDKCQLA